MSDRIKDPTLEQLGNLGRHTVRVGRKNKRPIEGLLLEGIPLQHGLVIERDLKRPDGYLSRTLVTAGEVLWIEDLDS